MDKPNVVVHNVHQELWFRPSKALPFPVLSKLFDVQALITTPRRGERDASHPKGYVLGSIATVRLFDEHWKEQLREDVRIIGVVSKPLRDFTVSDLKDTLYRSVESVQQDLSFFENEKPVALDDIVSLVVFSSPWRDEVINVFSRPRRSGVINS